MTTINTQALIAFNKIKVAELGLLITSGEVENVFVVVSVSLDDYRLLPVNKADVMRMLNTYRDSDLIAAHLDVQGDLQIGFHVDIVTTKAKTTIGYTLQQLREETIV